MFAYIAKDVVKDYENNIKLHFVDHLDRFLNVLFNKKERMKNLDERKLFFDELKTAKNMILFQNKKVTKKQKMSEIEQPIVCPKDLEGHLLFLVPQREFKKGTVYYDIQVSPQDYLPCLVYMMRYVETKELVVPNLFPLRTSIAPSYIRLDTKIIIEHLLGEQLGLKTNLYKDIVGKQKRYGTHCLN